MLQCDKRCLKSLGILMLIIFTCIVTDCCDAKRTNANLTACQHLRRAESRRSKALTQSATRVRVPRCNKNGAFEPIQCLNEKTGENCWCVDEFGVEIPGTRVPTKSSARCDEPENCPASACRMFCPAGFARDPQTGCSICRCRDPCDGIECPNGQSCNVQDVKCKNEPCPPIPTCKKARSIAHYCPSGLPLTIQDTVRPFLCGLEPGKPECPPLYRCLVESGNDYGVCCPSAVTFKKPGICPAFEKMDFTESTGVMCGSPCTHDLECRNMEKCCYTKGCQNNCQQPFNVTTCQQARAISEALAINEREGRSYLPDCNGPGGMFSPKQCSQNGLVCWCVDPRTGHKIPNSMGMARDVDCNGWENMIARSLGRSFNEDKCDTNICASICEYGFKNDHNGCPTCECSEPCEGFKCPMGSHCEVATDSLCESGSSFCASWPVCKPDLAYSNPCEIDAPLQDNETGEVMYCLQERQSRAFQPSAFFEIELDEKQARSMSNHIMCPPKYKCTKLRGEAESVCCPEPEPELEPKTTRTPIEEPEAHKQTMCEYLRDFSERMQGTEEGMHLAIPQPSCTEDGSYVERQCTMTKIKVTRAEQRKILEENTIRRMRMLLAQMHSSNRRRKRDAERLKLYRVDDSALKVNIAAPIMARSAKVIDVGNDRERQQGLGELFKTDIKKIATAPKSPYIDSNELVEIEVEECWCVDSFGTEIPRSRAFNVTKEMCRHLRDDIACLDLTCRMGCEFGFALDPITRCPACQCRDPCDGVSCSEGKECRLVDVSCDEDYCPPVPACLPRKPGQCPFLVPPGPDNLDAKTCAYECHFPRFKNTNSTKPEKFELQTCEDGKMCCSNGCGTQCVEPQMKTACQHLQAIQRHQSSELGIPAMKMYITQCDSQTGKWREIQCSPDGFCWCVDEKGQEMSGTRVKDKRTPICEENSAYQCPPQNCEAVCENGYKFDENGCQTCLCRDLCEDISCFNYEECQLISVECIDGPCPKLPICVPRRESVCSEGSPLKQGDLVVSCGPHNEDEICPTTHTCQLNPVTQRGVCCSKTRDVCFESIDRICLARSNSARNITRYRFKPKANKCIPVSIDQDTSPCKTKNLFHSEAACNSVCPVLTPCERLKLKNSLAAKRTGHSSAWFEPRCDATTGHWSPVQCLGRQPNQESTHPTTSFAGISRAFNTALDGQRPTIPYGVCWCADKKGAPLKGTMTRGDAEPICNSRQGRRNSQFSSHDPLMEELIMQMTMFNDVETWIGEINAEEEDLEVVTADEVEPRNVPDNSDSMAVESDISRMKVTVMPTMTAEESASVRATDHFIDFANSLLDSKLLSVEPRVKRLEVKQTRCQAALESAPHPVKCDVDGMFMPTQCNDRYCWCVDEAGNQLEASEIFKMDNGRRTCDFTPIDSVAIELHLQNQSSKIVRNLYDTVRMELHHMLGDVFENLRVQENFDGTALVKFELHKKNKVDLAFAIEMAAIHGELEFADGHYRPDITRSRFMHRISSPPMAQPIVSPEGTIKLVLFIMATSSAFLVSVFVVYIMLKRGGKRKVINGSYAYPIYAGGKGIESGDKAVDFSAPIFVLSASSNGGDFESIKPNIDEKNKCRDPA